MAKKQTQVQEKFKTMIGGQALIEGIMMRGPEKQAIVVRTKEGLVNKVEPLKQRKGVLTWPLIRGIVNFGSSMSCGVKALMYSAEVAGNEEEDDAPQSKFDRWLEKKVGAEKFMKIAIAAAVVLGLGFSIALFFLVPILLGDLFARLAGCGLIVQHLFEGLLRILIFLGYMFLVSRMKEMKRVFSYHGAEHKTIRCYEAKLPLTVENVEKMTRKHPRCGTSFLFVIMILSILLFTVASFALNAWIPALAALHDEKRVLYNLLVMAIKIFLLLPLVVSIGYECNRLVGRYDNWLTRILTAPGLWLQNLTTREPDAGMMEVAIDALERVLPARFVYPRCLGGGVMEARQPTGPWKPGPFGIEEPDPACSVLVRPEEIDTVLVPCVAFDESGGRLGHGAGYYDRYLARCPRAARICLAFKAQRLDRVVTEAHDLPMDWIVTEKESIKP